MFTHEKLKRKARLSLSRIVLQGTFFTNLNLYRKGGPYRSLLLALCDGPAYVAVFACYRQTDKQRATSLRLEASTTALGHLGSR